MTHLTSRPRRARLAWRLLVLGLAACASDRGADVRDADPDPVADGDAELPEPIPIISEEPAPLCGGSHPADYYQFLDDLCHVKARPAHVDREQRCPIVDLDAAGYLPGTAPIVVENVLGDLVPPDLDIVVIEIRRVDGVPHYRYLSNGRAEHAVQPWSTTKWIAAANAGARLRRESRGAWA